MGRIDGTDVVQGTKNTLIILTGYSRSAFSLKLNKVLSVQMYP